MQQRTQRTLPPLQANAGALPAPPGAQQAQKQAQVVVVQENPDSSSSENEYGKVKSENHLSRKPLANQRAGWWSQCELIHVNKMTEKITLHPPPHVR